MGGRLVLAIGPGYRKEMGRRLDMTGCLQGRHAAKAAGRVVVVGGGIRED